MIKVMSFFSLPIPEERIGRVVVISNSTPRGIGVVSLEALCLVPAWETVKDYKAGKISEAEYTVLYHKLICKRWPAVKQWLDGLSAQDMYLCCWERTGFCHRFLVAKLIAKFRPDIELRIQ